MRSNQLLDQGGRGACCACLFKAIFRRPRRRALYRTGVLAVVWLIGAYSMAFGILLLFPGLPTAAAIRPGTATDVAKADLVVMRPVVMKL